MILLLASEINNNIIQDYFKKYSDVYPTHTIRKEYTNSLKEYLTKAKNLDHFNYVIVDLDVVNSDTRKELIESFIKLRFRLVRTRIIILALNSDLDTVMELIKNRFFNLVLGNNSESIENSIRNCFSEHGTQFSQVSAYLDTNNESFLYKLIKVVTFGKFKRKKYEREIYLYDYTEEFINEE